MEHRQAASENASPTSQFHSNCQRGPVWMLEFSQPRGLPQDRRGTRGCDKMEPIGHKRVLAGRYSCKRGCRDGKATDTESFPRGRGQSRHSRSGTAEPFPSRGSGAQTKRPAESANRTAARARQPAERNRLNLRANVNCLPRAPRRRPYAPRRADSCSHGRYRPAPPSRKIRATRDHPPA